MPRLEGVKEEIHQPKYDTLVRDNAATTVEASSTLFANGRNVGKIGLTNKKAAGQLPSNQSYSILAMREYLSFGTPALYSEVDRGLFFKLDCGEKAQLQGHGWYLPAGGGVTGFDPNGGAFVTNGVPSHESILRVAKPITLPPQQDFQVEMLFKDVGSESALDDLNADTQPKVIVVLIDGILMRDAL
jgi:hypothetical protein